MKRILFVDDEPAILTGLRNALRVERKRWSMFFANGGKEALAVLAENPVDVVVSDMRMPEMDGLTLLTQVRDLYPNAIRIVLTGYADLVAITRVSTVAHQHLLKPCGGADLRAVLERACALQDTLGSESLQKTIGGLGTLPSAPLAYQALTEALADPDVEVARLASIVQRDVGMSSRVLQFVNSAYLGLTQKTTSIEAAIISLGLNALRHLALTFEVFSAFRGNQTSGISFAAFEKHALLTARIARKLAVDPIQAEAAFAAGLLHDAGKLVLLTRIPELFAQALEISRRSKKPLHEAEREVIGATHAEVGAYLLGAWGLPYSIVEPVAFHHTLSRITSQKDDVANVFFANALAHEVAPDGTYEAPSPESEEGKLLRSHTSLAEWRALAAREAAALSS